ncbi:hypothetical protein K7432_018024, partial [Basidiobolus ranarum]
KSSICSGSVCQDQNHDSALGTSTGTFQNVEISPKVKGKQKAAQTLQRTLSIGPLQGFTKIVKVLEEYFQKYEGKNAVQVCGKWLHKKSIQLEIQSGVDCADILEELDTVWHNIAGYPPDSLKNVDSAM